MALTIIAPTKQGGLAVIIVISDENIRRMKNHDPMSIHTQLAGLHSPNIESIAVAYATEEEMRLYEEWARAGKQAEVIENVFSGWEIGAGDHDTYEVLNINKANKPQ